jgi:hypothetical protein
VRQRLGVAYRALRLAAAQARRTGRKQVRRRELTDEREQPVLLPEARLRVSERRAPSRQARRLRAERPQVDWARLAELQEQVARSPQVPQVLAQQAPQDAQEVRSLDAAASQRVLMEPQPQDARQRAVLEPKELRRLARLDEQEREPLRQVLPAEPPEMEAVQRQARQPSDAAQAGPSARTSPPPRRPPLPQCLENACAPARHDPDRASSSAFSSQ